MLSIFATIFFVYNFFTFIFCTSNIISMCFFFSIWFRSDFSLSVLVLQVSSSYCNWIVQLIYTRFRSRVGFFSVVDSFANLTNIEIQQNFVHSEYISFNRIGLHTEEKWREKKIAIVIFECSKNWVLPINDNYDVSAGGPQIPLNINFSLVSLFEIHNSSKCSVLEMFRWMR